MINKKFMVIFIALCVLVLSAGCTQKATDSFSTGEGEQELNNSNNEQPDSSISIYQLSRDAFLDFLENPLLSALTNGETEIFTYCNAGDYHITSDLSCFVIDRPLIDFVSDVSKIEEYTKSAVEKIVVFEAPYIPLTIWTKTVEGDMYITINEQPTDKGYVFRLYTQASYKKIYGCINGGLIINDRKLSNELYSKIYNDYADVPLTVVLEALGASVDWQDSSNAAIEFHGKMYQLNIGEGMLCYLEDVDNNLLHQTDGGTVFIYADETDLMVDTNTLITLLDDMGEKVTVVCDKENAIVTIKPR